MKIENIRIEILKDTPFDKKGTVLKLIDFRAKYGWICTTTTTNEEAVFVKLCDIMANSLFSALSNSTMFNKYKTEYIQKVKPMLYCEQYDRMFRYLDKIYELCQNT